MRYGDDGSEGIGSVDKVPLLKDSACVQVGNPVRAWRELSSLRRPDM